MKKRDELADPNSCINKAADDEPVFVFRSQDLFATRVVKFWIELMEMQEKTPEREAKIEAAYRLVDEMISWRLTHKTKVPD